jgi:hypothetical protein
METLKLIQGLFATSVLLAACSAAGPAASHDESALSAPAAHPYKVMKKHFASPAVAPQRSDTPAPSGAQLTYRGGPVLGNVDVVTVFWDGKVQFQEKLNTFYNEVTQSPYYDWLSEYNTESQKIGHGKLLASFVDKSAPSSQQITDADVQTELTKLIDAGSIPKPSKNTLYMVHFPPGLSIDDSCTTWCAYHSSFMYKNQFAAYGVMPDQGGACDGGCGTAMNLGDNTTMVSSHELVEATTDADVGSNNLAWYDDTNGEIGDICVGNGGTVMTPSGMMTVQREWSNQKNDCITTT